MWVPGSQKEPKQLHGRKEESPVLTLGQVSWTTYTVLRRFHMCREWCTGPSPVSSPGDAVTRERRRGCRMRPRYRMQRRAGKSPLLGASQEEENANEISPWMSHLLLSNSKDHPERLD